MPGEMKTLSYRVSRIVLFAALAGVGPGCTEIFITSAMAPNTDHVYETGGATLQSGTLDVLFSWSYSIALEVQDSGHAGVRVQGANVRIWRGGRPQGSAFYTFYTPGAGYVGPDSSSVFFYDDVVPRQATGALLQFTLGVDNANELTLDDLRGYRDLITLGITIIGTDDNDHEVETQEFYYPVHLCAGCLITCPVESMSGDTGLHCESMTPPEATPCHLGQDDQIDCRLCVPMYDAQTCRDLCQF